MESESEIAKYFEGKSIFITGASGFVGKVLLEKLLYSCPGIVNVYILMRSKRCKPIEQRLEDMLKTAAFTRIKKECPERLDKIKLLYGDVGLKNLGLEPQYKQLIVDNVQIVFHSAASLRLGAKIGDAVRFNTEGTYEVMKLCKDIKQLQVVVHVSTAFCHVDHDVLLETVYPTKDDPMDIIRLCSWLDYDILESITPRLIHPHPNVYTYTKRLAETLVSKYYPELPVVIARPSIVIPAHKEPLPGWVDNLNGPVGVLIGAGKGVIRSMYCFPDYKAELMTVDMAANALIGIAWKVGSMTSRPKELPVFNITQSKTNEITWNEIVEKGRIIVQEYPFELMLWYPNGTLFETKILHDINVFLFHWIPAYVVDFLMIIFNQKPFLCRIQNKIQEGLTALQYFTTRHWVFINKEVLALRESMNATDKKMFSLDFEGIDKDEYMRNGLLGARVHILKESMDTIPRCRRVFKALWLLDRFCKLMFFFGLLWMILPSSVINQLNEYNPFAVFDDIDTPAPLKAINQSAKLEL